MSKFTPEQIQEIKKIPFNTFDNNFDRVAIYDDGSARFWVNDIELYQSDRGWNCEFMDCRFSACERWKRNLFCAKLVPLPLRTLSNMLITRSEWEDVMKQESK